MRVYCPEALNGFQAIRARRCAHLDKCERVGPAGFQRALHQLHARLAVQGGIDLEALAGTLLAVAGPRRTLRVQQRPFRAVLGAENLLYGRVNRRVIVDDQYTPIGACADLLIIGMPMRT